jgi:hypothetical protein
VKQDDVARSLMSRGWAFDRDSQTPYRTIASAIAEGGAGILEHISQQHPGSCEFPSHSHLIFRVCQHGRWARDGRGVIAWDRAEEVRLLANACTCPLRRFINEFHPVNAAAEWRRGLTPQMDSWFTEFLARQPRCSCVPLLAIVAAIGVDGRPSEVVAGLSHEAGRCRVRGEPASVRVSA